METTQINKGVTFILKKTIYLLFVGLLVMLMPSCKKDSAEKAHLSVQMTDAPGNYDAVMVDVQGVEVVCGGANVMLNTSSGIYNLLDFSNGLDTLIATGDLEAGTVSQIRLILGTNNTVVVDGIVYPLATPSAMQSGLKLQLHKTFEEGVSYSILMDFDANQSVVFKGNGEYQLKPVIRCSDVALTGSIKGSITPVGEIAVVTAVSVSDSLSYSSVTNIFGAFMINALPAGMYNITVTPVLPLLPVTITGKEVIIGASTNLGIIVL